MSASASWDTGPCWEADGGEVGAWDDVEEGDTTGPDQEEATNEFAQMLVDGYLAGEAGMNAKRICILCHWASLAGMKGLVAEMALRLPQLHSVLSGSECEAFARGKSLATLIATPAAPGSFAEHCGSTDID